LELTSYKKAEEVLHLYLKEINSIPKEHRQNKLSSKGFFDEITGINPKTCGVSKITHK
jgi:hypothetical protein